jgi:hypothetical protein
LNCLLLPWGNAEFLVGLRQSGRVGRSSFQHKYMCRRRSSTVDTSVKNEGPAQVNPSARPKFADVCRFFLGAPRNERTDFLSKQ